jgi:hypothetical protein
VEKDLNLIQNLNQLDLTRPLILENNKLEFLVNQALKEL